LIFNYFYSYFYDEFLGWLVLFELTIMALIEGEIKGNSAFNLLVPVRWEFADFGNDAIQVYNMMGTYMASLKKRWSEYDRARRGCVDCVDVGKIQRYSG
jgi:hypothetical protein